MYLKNIHIVKYCKFLRNLDRFLIINNYILQLFVHEKKITYSVKEIPHTSFEQRSFDERHQLIASILFPGIRNF